MAAKKPSPTSKSSAKKSAPKASRPAAPRKAAPVKTTAPAPKKSAPKAAATKAPVAKKSPAKAAPAKTKAPVAAKSSAKAPVKLQVKKAPAKTAPLAAKAKTLPKPVSESRPAAAPPHKSEAAPHAHSNGHAQTQRPAVSKAKPFSDVELQKFRKLLLDLRDRLVGDIKFLTTDNLHRAGRETGADLSGASQHSADHGTDNFDREFALSLATTEQDVLFEVDEALMRIEEKSYGICELSGIQIERARLEVIPYTRLSVQAQSRLEQSRARYRPFGQTFKAW
jgi:RNA polymerase-binding transcription factor DksA